MRKRVGDGVCFWTSAFGKAARSPAIDDTPTRSADTGVIVAGAQPDRAHPGASCSGDIAAAKIAHVDSAVGIRAHISRKVPSYQPSNITWAHLPPLPNRRLKKRERYEAMAERALRDLDAWLVTSVHPPA